jgi:hypothetical protein
MQCDWPVDPWYLPFGHDVHVEEEVEYVPEEQAVHTDDPFILVMKPAEQLKHTEAPLPLYFPRSQSVQLTELSCGEKLPASQAVHAVAPCFKLVWEPFEQVKHESVRAWGAYLPVSQYTHSVLLRLYSPAEQSLQ